MLCAWAAIEIQVLFNLRFLASGRGFVDRKFDTPATVLHNLGHERGILGANGTVIEVNHLCEAHYALIKGDPLVHFAQFNVADNMVNASQTSSPCATRYRCIERAEAGEERAFVVLALDKGMNGVAIGGNRGKFYLTIIIPAH